MTKYDVLSESFIARKNKDIVKIDVLNELKDLISSFERENKTHVNGENIIDFLTKMSKNRVKSIDMYVNGGREDLADKEIKELEYINECLPKKMNDEELKTAIQETIDELINTNGEDFQLNIGDLMKTFKSKFKGQNMSLVSKMINATLNSK